MERLANTRGAVTPRRGTPAVTVGVASPVSGRHNHHPRRGSVATLTRTRPRNGYSRATADSCQRPSHAAALHHTSVKTRSARGGSRGAARTHTLACRRPRARAHACMQCEGAPRSKAAPRLTRSHTSSSRSAGRREDPSPPRAHTPKKRGSEAARHPQRKLMGDATPPPPQKHPAVHVFRAHPPPPPTTTLARACHPGARASEWTSHQPPARGESPGERETG